MMIQQIPDMAEKMQKKACCIYHTETGGKILPLLQLTFPPFAHLPKPPESLKFPHSPPSPRILFLFDFLGKGKGTSSAWLKDGEGFGLQTRYYCITHPPPTYITQSRSHNSSEREKKEAVREGRKPFFHPPNVKSPQFFHL